MSGNVVHLPDCCHAELVEAFLLLFASRQKVSLLKYKFKTLRQAQRDSINVETFFTRRHFDEVNFLHLKIEKSEGKSLFLLFVTYASLAKTVKTKERKS